jgi:hypothetical protein
MDVFAGLLIVFIVLVLLILYLGYRYWLQTSKSKSLVKQFQQSTEKWNRGARGGRKCVSFHEPSSPSSSSPSCDTFEPSTEQQRELQQNRDRVRQLLQEIRHEEI